MVGTNTIVPRNGNTKMTFTQAIRSKSLDDLIVSTIKDENAKQRFISTLIQTVASSYQLQNCQPASIVAAALRGEGEGLILGHGYYVTPYGDKAVYVRAAKGYIALALSTGYYADIDCLEVREGEKKGRDPKTGKPIIDFSVYDSEEESQKHPIIGYYAYFQLKDGYFRYEYWPMEKIRKHAHRYSYLDLDALDRLKNGTATADDKKKAKQGSPWYDVEGSGFDLMCKKTVIKSLLNSGYAPLSNEVKSAIQNYDDVEDQTEAMFAAVSDNILPEQPELKGKIIQDEHEQPKNEETVKDEKVKAEEPKEPKKAHRASQKADEQVEAPAVFESGTDEDFLGEEVDSFFGD